MTQSKQIISSSQGQMLLDVPGLKRVVGKFDGGAICSDGGLLILRKADTRLGLTEFASFAICDNRRPEYVKHSIVDMLKQRIYGIAAGYEDCNDAAQLRFDAMHKLAVGRMFSTGLPSASQPSLSRFENLVDATTNAALQRLLVHLFVRRRKKAPKVLRLAMDTTCDETYGYQQMSFYNGYYETFCYAPLFIFTECGFPLCALLRPGNPNPIDDAIRMLKQVFRELRLSWPDVRIELSADAAFASSEMFNFLEDQRVTYFISAAGHAGYAYHAEKLVKQCKFVRKFGEFGYRAREWRSDRRIIFRVHFDKSGPDTRFVVTNATKMTARKIYENKYCPRCQCENWIKDLKLYLKSGRTSCQEFEANQFRVLLHTFAYILIWDVRKRAQLKDMTIDTFRLQLLKIGVLVKETGSKIMLHLASQFAWRDHFFIAWLKT